MPDVSLDYNMLVDLWHRVTPPIWYGTLDAIARGQFYIFKPDAAEPWFACHQDDLVLLKAEFPRWRFRHLREQGRPAANSSHQGLDKNATAGV